MKVKYGEPTFEGEYKALLRQKVTKSIRRFLGYMFKKNLVSKNCRSIGSLKSKYSDAGTKA